jgi:hypothetical protein
VIGRSKAHLAAASETYWEHLRFARTIGLLSLAAGIACLIHALIPALCTTTASRTIGRINQLLAERGRIDEVQSATSDTTAFVLLLMLSSATVAPLWFLPAATELRLAYTVLAFALPLTMLLTNPELEAATEPHAA